MLTSGEIAETFNQQRTITWYKVEIEGGTAEMEEVVGASSQI
jgi:hypothetical protein